uniref:uncharacterized protein LOC122590795 n=1 Tax=Erigeron canadensis TaxID=72917 RepID=UPI001CB9CA98|nr:uncharacterized protein LOC122590795 [Erigeron canadensis]
MLNESSLPNKFWVEAVNTSCHTQNRCLIVKRHDKTAYEVLRRKKPQIKYFLVFGCPVFILNNRDHLGKFDPKADDGYFVGYSSISKAFRVFNVRLQKVDESIHVTFDESSSALKDIQSSSYEEVFSEFTNPSNEEADSFSDAPCTLPECHQQTSQYTSVCTDKEQVVAHIYSIEPVELILRSIQASSANNRSLTKDVHADDLAEDEFHDASANAEDMESADDSNINDNSTQPNDSTDHPVAEPTVTIDLSSYNPLPAVPITLSSADTQLGSSSVPALRWTVSHPAHQVIGDPQQSIVTRSASRNTCLYVNFLSMITPKNIGEAMVDPSWVAAMQEELTQFQRQHVWFLVPLPHGKVYSRHVG